MYQKAFSGLLVATLVCPMLLSQKDCALSSIAVRLMNTLRIIHQMLMLKWVKIRQLMVEVGIKEPNNVHGG